MQASPAEHQVYVWNPPGARQTVELQAGVVDRIAECARAGLETDGRGIENGGLLIGRTRRERGRTVVEVADAEPVECEHAAGPSWMLSNTDRRAMDAQIRSHKGAVVGCFRSNTRKEFIATVEDFGLLDSHFPVMLLVDARRGAPLRAGFVFRGDREMGPDFLFTREALNVVAVPPPPIRMVVPAPPERRIAPPKIVVAAAAIVLGIVAGVWYGAARRTPGQAEAKDPAPTVARTEPSKPETELQPAPAPIKAPEVATEPAPVASTDHAAPAASPAVSADRAAPPPTVSADRVTPPATPVDRAAAPPTPNVSADRTAPPPAPGRPPRRDFVPPEVARIAAPPAQTPDLPAVEGPRTAVPTIVAGGSAPRPPAPIPTPALPPEPPPAIESKVAVAVDPIPVHGGRFAPPETIQPAPPRGMHVDRAVVINVRVYLDRSGKVEYAELLSDGTGANRDLASAAVFSARKWRFSPARVDGKAIPAQAVLRFRFLPDTR